MNTYFSRIIQRNALPASGSALLPANDAADLSGGDLAEPEMEQASAPPRDQATTVAAPTAAVAAPRTYTYLERQVARAVPAEIRLHTRPLEKQPAHGEMSAGDALETNVSPETRRDLMTAKRSSKPLTAEAIPDGDGRSVAGAPPETGVLPASLPLPTDHHIRQEREHLVAIPALSSATPVRPLLPGRVEPPAASLLAPLAPVTPRAAGKTKKDTTPKLVIGRITVELAPPVQPAPRPAARPPAAAAPKVGSPVNKLTFGFGQL